MLAGLAVGFYASREAITKYLAIEREFVPDSAGVNPHYFLEQRLAGVSTAAALSSVAAVSSLMENTQGRLPQTFALWLLARQRVLDWPFGLLTTEVDHTARNSASLPVRVDLPCAVVPPSNGATASIGLTMV